MIKKVIQSKKGSWDSVPRSRKADILFNGI